MPEQTEERADEDVACESVGVRLKQLRRRLGISQRELARRAGIPNGNLSLIEQGKVSPSVSSLAKILNAANLSLKEFFALSLHNTEPLIEDQDFVAVSHQGGAWRLKSFNYPRAAVNLIQTAIAPDAEVAVPPGVEGKLWVGLVTSGEVELICNGGSFHVKTGSVVELASVSGVRLVNRSSSQALFTWFAVS